MKGVVKEELSIFLHQHTTAISTSKTSSVSPNSAHSMQINCLYSQDAEEQQKKETKKM